MVPRPGRGFLMASEERAIRSVRKGLSGRLVVNGQKYDGAMPALPLTDQQVADVLSTVALFGAYFGLRLRKPSAAV